MLKKYSIFIAALIMFMILPKSVEAAPVKTEMSMKGELSAMELDEDKKKLFVLSKPDKKLTIVNTDTLEVSACITFDEKPEAMIMDEDSLYISFPGSKEIKKLDMVTGKEQETLSVKESPYGIIKNGMKLYYHCDLDVVEYDLQTKTEKLLDIMPRAYSRFTLNEKDQILYVAEYGLTRTRLVYYDLKNYKIISETRHEFSKFAGGKMCFTQDTLYYYDREFNKLDSNRCYGNYDGDAIFSVQGEILYATNGIYNRESHEKVGDYREKPKLMAAGSKTVFIYLEEMRKIYKFGSDETITLKNVISVLKGTTKTPVPQREKATKRLFNHRILNMQSSLSDWILDEDNQIIYTISNYDKALFFIDSNTLDLKDSMVFTCNPSDIALYHGYLYVSFNDSKQIKVIDIKTKEIVKTLYTKDFPYQIVIDLDQIYYATPDSFNSVYIYDLKNDTEKNIENGYARFYRPALAVNTKDHILYIGDSGISSGELYYLDTRTNTIVAQKKDGPRLDYPERRIVFDGTNIYYAERVFDALDPNKILGKFSGDTRRVDIICVKNNLVYTPYLIYDKDTFARVEYLDGNSSLFEVSNDGSVIRYDGVAKKITKINKENIVTVSYDTVGGSVQSKAEVDRDSQLQNVDAPRKNGHAFLGWYKDAAYTIPVDFTKDLATDSMTIYAKWLENAEIPQSLKAAPNGVSKINLSWKPVQDAKGYAIYRSTGLRGNYVYIGETSANEYIDTSRKTGATYYYKIKAYKEHEQIKAYSNYSEIVSAKTILGTVATINGTALNAAQTSLTWSGVNGADGYEVYIADTILGTYRLVASTKLTSHKIDKLKADTKYYYKVRAYRLEGQEKVYSRFSTSIMIQTQSVKKAAVPVKVVVNKPTAVSVKKKSSSSSKVTWKKISGADGYEVYRATTEKGKYSKVKSLKGNTFTDTKLAKKKTYYYKVRAYKVVNNKKVYSSYSVIKQFKLK